jgi:hypothetical protein
MSRRNLSSIHRTLGVGLILLLGASLFGCGSSAPPRVAQGPNPSRLILNSSPQPIGVLYRLAPSDVELAILLAIGNPPEVPALKPGQAITDDVLPVVLGGSPQFKRPMYPWSFVKREPGLIHTAYERGSVQMLVAITFDEQLVMLSIVESQNLGQQGDRIRPEAFTYLADLDDRIRANVEAIAQRNWYGTPVPASP